MVHSFQNLRVSLTGSAVKSATKVQGTPNDAVTKSEQGPSVQAAEVVRNITHVVDLLQSRDFQFANVVRPRQIASQGNAQDPQRRNPGDRLTV